MAFQDPQCGHAAVRWAAASREQAGEFGVVNSGELYLNP
jgi:hypothetical protein